MRLAIFFIAFLSTILISCTKDEISSSADITAPTNIEGVWNYIGFSGSIAGIKFTPVNSGSFYIQVKDSQLILISAVQGMQKCGSYTFFPDATSSGNQLTGLLKISDTSIILPMAGIKDYRVTLLNDTLTLYPDKCDDCFVTVYTPSLMHFNCSDNRQ